MSLGSAIFQITPEQLQKIRFLLERAFPELEVAREERAQLAQAPQVRKVLALTEHLLVGLETLPQTSYTDYRLFRSSGDRERYEAGYFLKRARLSAVALRLFLWPDAPVVAGSDPAGMSADEGAEARGETQPQAWQIVLAQDELRARVQDYLWSICEESTWVLPAHERDLIDLFAAETGYLLAETLLLLGELLDEEVRHRVRLEIERRIFEPYLHSFHTQSWYTCAHNWNGVCNSSIAATFLLLEPEQGRMHRALEIALRGLQAFLETAFAEDGSSSEGVAYWHYGLFNFVALAEMLSACSAGQIDLLAGERMRHIAAFPAQLQLSATSFASFSDSEEQVRFHPGILTRLAQRTAQSNLQSLLAHPAEPESDWRLPMMLRDILWWNGSRPAGDAALADAYLPVGGKARLVAQGEQGPALVLCLKGGHNAEDHNHNDIGSFLLHIAGDNFLTDPGRGLYSRAYFGPERYENIFANSYGHSVPRIDRLLQGSGRAFAGTLHEISRENGCKRIALDFAAAYPCPDLLTARRELCLAIQGADAGSARLRDLFQFAHGTHQIEEAFITWLECSIDGPTARIHGQQHTLLLTIEQPHDLHFHLEYLTRQSEENHKPRTLKRLSFVLPAEKEAEVSVKMVTHAHEWPGYVYCQNG